MHFETARAILATPTNHSSHQVVSDSEDLIWAEHGDEVEQWNAVAALEGWGPITVRCEDGPGLQQSVFYSYRGEETLCTFAGDRDDNLRSVHLMAAKVGSDAELYACNDVNGNSEWAFLALSPEQRKSLEAEFGAAAFTKRLTRVGGTFDDFCTKYFGIDNREEYEEESLRAHSLPDLMSSIWCLGTQAGASTDCQWVLVGATWLNILIVCNKTKRCEALMGNDEFIAKVTRLCTQFCLEHSYQLQCISFLSKRASNPDWQGKPTVDWMSPGACLQLRFD